ncbi:hypothetical protein BC567DRAFT_206946 [Phyllosticta citribraziliensis]
MTVLCLLDGALCSYGQLTLDSLQRPRQCQMESRELEAGHASRVPRHLCITAEIRQNISRLPTALAVVTMARAFVTMAPTWPQAKSPAYFHRKSSISNIFFGMHRGTSATDDQGLDDEAARKSKSLDQKQHGEKKKKPLRDFVMAPSKKRTNGYPDRIQSH